MNMFLSALLLVSAVMLPQATANATYQNKKDVQALMRNTPHVEAFIATIMPISGASVRGVQGTVTVVTSADNSTVAYSGSIINAQRNLVARTCTATNGCGVHIHNGFNCDNSTAQGGHYFTAPVTSDPWVDQRYSSDSMGRASFGEAIKMGTIDVNKRAFLVHAEDGSRIGCGILRRSTRVSRAKAVADAQKKLKQGQKLLRRGYRIMREANAILEGL